MKKIYIIITVMFMITLLLCTGCSSDKINININQNSEEYIANEDYQYFLDSYSSFIKTDGGYYFVTDLKLYFYDTEKKESYLVCSKANCKHSDSDCSAYLSPLKYIPMAGMSYYNHSLYILGYEKSGESKRQNYIYQINLDNFKHKKTAYLFDSSSAFSVDYVVHRGYVYFVYGQSSMTQGSTVLYRTKLGNTKNDAPEAIYEFSGIGTNLFGLHAYGNNIFFITSSYEDEEGNGYKTTGNIMDIHSLEAKGAVDALFASYLNEEYIYFENDKNSVHRIHIHTNEEEFFCSIDGPAYISADSKYIYFDNKQKMYIDENFNDRKIYVYDKSGNYITEIVPKNPKDDCYFGGDDVMIFKEIIGGEIVESDGAKGYYVLDKSQLTSPDKQFIDIE
ncbi:MAG: hypothetical protein K2J59_08950 [Eubacterium sp.]|nr:hypothetical protein [Eubacterium sp.]